MATYSTIKGTAVQTLASNAGNEGQIWYDTANNNFQLQKDYGTASWSTGGNMNTGRRQVAGFGESIATAVVVCGQDPTALNLTEEYNGSAWSAETANPEVRVKPFGFGINQ